MKEEDEWEHSLVHEGEFKSQGGGDLLGRVQGRRSRSEKENSELERR